MEGDDQQDPIVDAVRSLLDGHIVLSRALASDGLYPAVEVLDSVSRLMPSVVSETQKVQAALVRRLMATYARSEDLVRIGAYKTGSDVELDRAIRARPLTRRFLEQGSNEIVSLVESQRQLDELAGTL